MATKWRELCLRFLTKVLVFVSSNVELPLNIALQYCLNIMDPMDSNALITCMKPVTSERWMYVELYKFQQTYDSSPRIVFYLTTQR